MIDAVSDVRIDPKEIPDMEMKLLCATILDAVIRFYKEPENVAAFEKWQARKGEKLFEPGNRE